MTQANKKATQKQKQKLQDLKAFTKRILITLTSQGISLRGTSKRPQSLLIYGEIDNLGNKSK